MNINKVGYNIMDALAEQHMSISGLARKAGFHRMTVSHWIHDPGKMPVDGLYCIAKVLGKTMSELCKGVLNDGETN